MVTDRIQKQFHNEKFRLFACAASGIFSSLPFFASNLYLFEWISLIPFFCVLLSDKEYTKRQAFRYGFVFHGSLSVFVLLWFRELLSMSAIDYPKALMIAVVLAADLLISALQSFLFGMSAVLSRQILRNRRCAVADAVLCALFPTVAELILSFGRFGFPWVVLYLTQRTFLPGIQTASLFGGHFVSFLIYLCNFLLAKGILTVFHAPARKISRLLPFGAALLLFFSNLSAGFILGAPRGDEKTVMLALYQDNHSSYEKWSGDPMSVCDEFIAAFEAAYRKKKAPDLILLSETVFTTTLGREDSPDVGIGRRIEEKLCDLSARYGTKIVCGGFYEKDGKQYNAQFLFENGMRSKEVYCKRTLVPFGEYVPYEAFFNRVFPFLRDMNLSGDTLTAGKDPVVFTTDIATFGGLICYDSIFYQNARNSARNKADFLLLSTNDSWYNDSAAIDQHYGHAVFRAIENRKSILRCATTGRSGLIDAYGRSVKQTSLFTRCIISSDLSYSTKNTLFTRFGYGYIVLLLVLCLSARVIFGKSFSDKTEGQV